MTEDYSEQHLAHVPSFRRSPIVFSTVATHERKQILADARCHEILHGLWERSAEKDDWYVGQYVVMPDHVHLFARPASQADLIKDWVKMWKSVSARALVSALGLDGALWQADYFDRYLRSSESYREKWFYMQNNPVRAGLVSQVSEWPYQGKIHDLSF